MVKEMNNKNLEQREYEEEYQEYKRMALYEDYPGQHISGPEDRLMTYDEYVKSIISYEEDYCLMFN